ncbi:MAG: hypothetical protein M1420_03350 [Actinobacteria bacterium]|jgi:hypothetical protein|nr:hypothetical protein [Actinomycetota bacterium]
MTRQTPDPPDLPELLPHGSEPVSRASRWAQFGFFTHGHSNHHGIDIVHFNRVVSFALVAIVAGLIPWTVFLAIKLPIRYRAHHWTLLWVGFDVILMAVLAYTAWAAWFRKQIMVVMAIVAGTMLMADAWFDVITSLGHRGDWITLATALLAEIPGAVFFFWLARTVILRSIANVYRLAGAADPPARLRDASVLYDLSPLSSGRKPRTGISETAGSGMRQKA